MDYSQPQSVLWHIRRIRALSLLKRMKRKPALEAWRGFVEGMEAAGRVYVEQVKWARNGVVVQFSAQESPVLEVEE